MLIQQGSTGEDLAKSVIIKSMSDTLVELNPDSRFEDPMLSKWVEEALANSQVQEILRGPPQVTIP